MLRRVVTGVAMACLMGGAAYAQDETGGQDNQCADQLTKAEEIVHDKIDSGALSQDDADKANILLDEAQDKCTSGDSAGAITTLDSVMAMTGKAN